MVFNKMLPKIMPNLIFIYPSAAFQEKKIINDIAKIRIISDFSRQLLTNLNVFLLIKDNSLRLEGRFA